jgi:predicted metal-dependent hydrolase
MTSRSNSLHSDLPNYTVKVSHRAKCVRLSLSVEDGLEVVVPANYDQLKIPELVRKKRDWIDRNQRKLDEREAFFHSQDPHDLPDKINLRSQGEEWQVEYQQATTRSGFFSIKENKESLQLIVSGNITEIDSCKAILKQWLMKKAEKHLLSGLQKLSVRAKLPYHAAAVRGQKTLWGSCSRDRNISLNYKLLFLEPKVVEYVLIHELCHTVHMNHSSKFWNLVAKFEPNYQVLDKSLNQSWQVVPAWLDLV